MKRIDLVYKTIYAQHKLKIIVENFEAQHKTFTFLIDNKKYIIF